MKSALMNPSPGEERDRDEVELVSLNSKIDATAPPTSPSFPLLPKEEREALIIEFGTLQATAKAQMARAQQRIAIEQEIKNGNQAYP